MRWGLIILLISYIIVYLNTRSHFWTVILIGMTYFLGFTKIGRRKVKIFVQKELIGGIKQTKNKSKASRNFNDMQRKAFVFLTEDNTFLYKILSFLKLKEPMLTEEEFMKYATRFWVDQDQAKKESGLIGELKYKPIKIFEFITQNPNKKYIMYTKEIGYCKIVSNILRVGWVFITQRIP